ncbi:MAG: hypothetical protein ACRELV_14635 [Longimicrobiales bacterium]
MKGTELARGHYYQEANPTTNPAGNSTTYRALDPQLFNHYPIHQLQENNGINWIVVDSDIIYNETNSYFEQIRVKDGILLKLVDIYKNEDGNPDVPQQLENHR